MTVGVPVDESSGVNICLCHLVKTVDQTVNTSLINTSQRHWGYWTCLKPNNTTTVLVKILPGGLVIDCTPSKTPQGCSFIKKIQPLREQGRGKALTKWVQFIRRITRPPCLWLNWSSGFQTFSGTPHFRISKRLMAHRLQFSSGTFFLK